MGALADTAFLDLNLEPVLRPSAPAAEYAEYTARRIKFKPDVATRYQHELDIIQTFVFEWIC
jgi:hypothetical protein